MDFDEKDDNIILLLLVVSGITSLLNILPNSRRLLVWIKIKKVLLLHYIGTKIQDRYYYRKCFCMNSETHFNFLLSV